MKPVKIYQNHTGFVPARPSLKYIAGIIKETPDINEAYKRVHDVKYVHYRSSVLFMHRFNPDRTLSPMEAFYKFHSFIHSK